MHVRRVAQLLADEELDKATDHTPYAMLGIIPHPPPILAVPASPG